MTFRNPTDFADAGRTDPGLLLDALQKQAIERVVPALDRALGRVDDYLFDRSQSGNDNLGLTALRPFRIIDASGAVSEVADADPEVLRLPVRTLAVDAVRETIWRRGTELADLRRRSLLKKLLFLFAAAPGKTFSKEEIVQTVWSVAYHPLRHDAALFTNIMRIRRLLGEDGAEIIRVTEDGYRFEPPSDFVFVSRSV